MKNFFRLLVFSVLMSMTGKTPGASPVSEPERALPRPDHVVVVIEENHAFEQIIGKHPDAGFINKLASNGALLTGYQAVTHPSQPNYLVLFSGSTQNVRDDAVPAEGSPFRTPNLAEILASEGYSFRGYAEDLPYPGFAGAWRRTYARKHCPWANWRDTVSLGYPMSAFPSDYAKLPTISFVIPGQKTDMHSGPVSAGDAWLKKNVSGYIDWAGAHNSLFILTFDEDNRFHGNHIPTLFVGPMVKKGLYPEPASHYDLYQTLLDLYGLPGKVNGRKKGRPILDIWN